MVDLKSQFENSARDATGADIEKLRADYYIQAVMSGSDESSIGGLQIKMAGREQSALAEKKKRDQNLYQMFVLEQLYHRLADLEGDLENRYGENFAEDMLAGLHEQGLMDQDAYQNIMAVSDDNARKQAIALYINEGLQDGRFTADQVHEDSRALEWVDLHADIKNAAQLEGIEYLHGQTSAADLSADGNRSAGYGTDYSSTNVNELASHTTHDRSGRNVADGASFNLDKDF